MKNTINFYTLNILITDGPKIRDEEGPKVLAPPPTAYTSEPIFSLGVAVDTLGEYK